MKYQRNVETLTDIRLLYEYVVSDPRISEYRGFTDSGLSVEWEPVTKGYRTYNKETWFPNPAYAPNLAFSFEDLLGAQQTTI